jgi:hypothetical protein
MVGDTQGLLVAILFLFPVVFGGVLLPRWGSWLGGAGFWLVLFSATTCLAYNSTHPYSGQSFFWSWVF